MPLTEHVYYVAIAFKMYKHVEQQICTNFVLSLNIPPQKPSNMIQKTFRDDAMRAVQIKAWHRHFKDGQKS